MNQMNKLKPCPFCKGSVKIMAIAGKFCIQHNFPNVNCILFTNDIKGLHLDRLIQKWNNRGKEMTEYEKVYMELRGCTFDVELPQESVTAIIQSMIDKTTLVCGTRAPKKICANCKHWKKEIDGWGICDCKLNSYNEPTYTLFDDLGTYKDGKPENKCDKWESIE